MPRMGFGAMRILAGGPEPVRALLDRALELGVALIDTADVYRTEEAIAEALSPYPQGVVIATKDKRCWTFEPAGIVVEAAPASGSARFRTPHRV